MIQRTWRAISSFLISHTYIPDPVIAFFSLISFQCIHVFSHEYHSLGTGHHHLWPRWSEQCPNCLLSFSTIIACGLPKTQPSHQNSSAQLTTLRIRSKLKTVYQTFHNLAVYRFSLIYLLPSVYITRYWKVWKSLPGMLFFAFADAVPSDRKILSLSSDSCPMALSPSLLL